MRRLFIVLILSICSFSLEAKVVNHPIKKIKSWFEMEKEKSERGFHQFATLSTVDKVGHPYGRMIEIVGMSENNGILFFTHRNTQKAEHLSLTPHAALNIWLPKTFRQISINGEVKEASRTVAEKAWKAMPLFLKVDFLSSEHKGVLSSPDILEERKAKIKESCKQGVLTPDAFVGYYFTPTRAIFYERSNHSIQRERAELTRDNTWNICQLEP